MTDFIPQLGMRAPSHPALTVKIAARPRLAFYASVLSAAGSGSGWSQTAWDTRARP